MVSCLSNVFFTSDLHLNHSKAIKYSNRPFHNVDEMNSEIIKRWNSVVSENDTVYILGDMFFCGTQKALEFLEQLPGKKHLILGNHDKRMNATVKAKFESVSHYKEIYIEKQAIVLSHYSFRVWNKSHYGSWMLYGHSHGTLPPHGRSVDVGVDNWNFTPVSFRQIKEFMKNRPIHGEV